MRATTPKAETPLSLYKRSLAPWLTLAHEGQQKVVAALELLVLQGREVPLDGRAVVAENSASQGKRARGYQPQARHSKPGDIIALESPQEISAFVAYRRTFDLIIGDVKTGPSEGEHAYEAMTEAIMFADKLDHKMSADKVHQFLLNRIRRHPVMTVIAAYVSILVVCIALSGGIFFAVPSGGTAAYGGVYLVNKYTGEVSFCAPAGCR
jgi:hypothetical protein